MPRRNNRDKKYEPKEYENNTGSYFSNPSEKPKPTRRRKGKWDKNIYKSGDENGY